MATHTRTSNLMKPWAWLAAVAAVCLVLASSTALYAINSGVRLGLPWWTAVAAPALVYALVLPLCIPRIRLRGDRKSTRLNSSHYQPSRMPSSA